MDAFTDRHPVVQRSIARIGPTWGWFSGILIDVYYDHLLALDWDRYSDVPLRAFVDRAHGVIRDHAEFMPEPARGHAAAVRRDGPADELRRPGRVGGGRGTAAAVATGSPSGCRGGPCR